MKKIAVVVLSLFISLLFFACGGAEEKGEETQAEAKDDEVVVLELARFFGEPDDELMDSTDLNKANSEAAAIQILTNIFNEEHEGEIRVEKLGGSKWGSFYDQLNTTFAANDPPDVAVMHQSNMPAYASRDLLVGLDDYYESYDLNPSDWTAPAQKAVSYQGSSYGVPFDLHGNLLHVNVDLFKEAGLVDENGVPILPTSTEEWFEQAQTMKEKTGKLYWVEDATQFPISFRLFHSLMEQQGVPVIHTETNAVNIDSEAGKKALEFMQRRFQEGYSDPNADYTAAGQLFMNGEAAIEMNGTWVVDQYNEELSFDYRAMNFPNLMGEKKVWANSHMWVIPKQKESNRQYEAAMEFCKFLGNHVYEWAVGSGHIAPRKSALQKLEENDIPQRAHYAETASNAATFPPVISYSKIETSIKEEIEKTWLLDESVDSALKQAQKRVESVLGE
jgi:multiple sugar transport system substrate-binding protein